MEAIDEQPQVRQIYPIQEKVSLKGLYLTHQIRSIASNLDRPFVYANFVTSLDGRIAVPHSSGIGLTVPRNIANDRDWRLFQELVAQADIIISSGRYLRDWADGRAQEILRVDDPRFADLSQWRQDAGLSPQPDIAIVSRTLDFQIPELLQSSGRRAIVFTTEQADPRKLATLESKLDSVFIAGKSAVDGREMIEQLGKLEYRAVYSAAGPQMLHTLLTAQVLDRLYMTQVGRILGGAPFSSIVEGTLLPRATNFQLNAIYADSGTIPRETSSVGQLFFSYDRIGTS